MLDFTWTNPQMIALGVMTVISYIAGRRILLGLSGIGIMVLAFSWGNDNLPLSILGFLFGLFTIVYGWVKK